MAEKEVKFEFQFVIAIITIYNNQVLYGQLEESLKMVKMRNNQWIFRGFHIYFPFPEFCLFFFEEISVSLKVFFSLVHFICNYVIYASF